MKLVGEVERGRIGGASKSAGIAVTISASEGRFVLRRIGGPAFDDPALAALVGKRIAAEGEVSATTFLVERWTILPTKEDAPKRRPPRR